MISYSTVVFFNQQKYSHSVISLAGMALLLHSNIAGVREFPLIDLSNVAMEIVLNVINIQE